MSSRSDMSYSQETPSSWSAFRDDKDEENVVDQMYEAANQMGEDMPIGLGGTFEYRGVEKRVRGREEMEGADQSGRGDEWGD
ncbi:hypothetical protein Pyn_07081 [Prunus yedoensis var. nudiflora]|uniref:Uncharacterized protein n=1 Tax=Prunus yedoensis var. nudiflora TaxID=2094558 RepID=A0A314ZIZ6_PRUYE|nr:hypothetical protein Pyn_07081 [Prunus yedoensis var. nudiflora]